MKNFKDKILSGDPRTLLAKKNILGSLGLKAIDVLIDLVLVPLALSYLTQTNYGIWLTINSMVVWFNLLDVGLTHGLRNKLAVAIARNDHHLIKSYTSTAYTVITLICIVIASICYLTVPFINWNFVLNVDGIANSELMSIMLIVLTSFILNLLFKTITSIFLAKQLSVLVSLVNTIGKISITIALIASIYFAEANNLVLFATIYSFLPLLVLVVFTLILFSNKYKSFRPSIRYYEFSKVKEIMNLGISFFIIQIGATILFMTDNLIISHLFHPAEVTPYQITNKYFGVLLMLFTIVLSPFWSAITEAYEKSEIDWIRKTISKLHKLWAALVVGAAILLLLHGFLIKLWVGSEINIPFLLAFQFFLFVCFQTLNSIYTYFLNGVSILRIQLYTGLFTIFLNIPLSIFFAKTMALGTAGVIMATNVSMLIYIVLRKTQYHKIVNGTATGIWSK